jgi:Glycosyl transferase family 2
MQKPLVICLTPIKNEVWILERFLKCASLWADHIIIADQHSDDGSREVARSFPSVTLIENSSEAFNEPDRQQLLISEARKIPGPKVLMALDADEFLTSNFLSSPEWETIRRSPAGTVIRFQWLEVFANTHGLCYFRFPWDPPIGLVDDGSEHKGSAIHSVRIPWKADATTVTPTKIKLMHYCLLDRERFKSRIRWYQCYEHLKTSKRPMSLYRFYHQDLFVGCNAITQVPKDWVQGYEERGIDMSSVQHPATYRWDLEVLKLFEKHGTARFKRLGIWDANWTELHRQLYPQESATIVADPRTLWERVVQKWLRLTQPDFCHYAKPGALRSLMYRIIEKILQLFGW